MIRQKLLSVTVTAGLGVIAGCTTPGKEGFADVQQTVAERTGQRVQWNRHAGEDRQAEAAVRSLLNGELTADRAVQIALLNNRSLQAVFEDVGVAQADLVQAGLLRNPVFDGAVQFADMGGDPKLEFGIAADFLDVFQIPLRKRVAEAALAGAKARVAGAVIDVAGQTRAAFYSLQASQQLLELRRSVLTATEASYDLSQRLHAAGNVRDLDVTAERAMYEQSKLDVVAAEIAVKRDRERLNMLMSLWGRDVQWAVTARIADPPADEPAVEEVERRAVEKSLELAAAKNDVMAAGQTLGLNRSFAFLQELEVGAVTEREAEGTWETGPTLSVPIPLFDQGQARVASARARLEQARQRYYAAAVGLRASARLAREELIAARTRAEYQRRVILPLRHQIVEQTQLQYNAMQTGAFQLLQARQAEIEAGVMYIDSVRNYWVARTRLDQILNGRQTDLGAAGSMMTSTSGASAQGRDSGGH